MINIFQDLYIGHTERQKKEEKININMIYTNLMLKMTIWMALINEWVERLWLSASIH